MMNPSEKILQLISYYGLNKTEFARRCGINPSVIIRITNEGIYPSSRTIARICDYYKEINPDWIKGDSSEMFIVYNRPYLPGVDGVKQRLFEALYKNNVSIREAEKIAGRSNGGLAKGELSISDLMKLKEAYGWLDMNKILG